MSPTSPTSSKDDFDVECGGFKFVILPKREMKFGVLEGSTFDATKGVWKGGKVVYKYATPNHVIIITTQKEMKRERDVYQALEQAGNGQWISTTIVQPVMDIYNMSLRWAQGTTENRIPKSCTKVQYFFDKTPELKAKMDALRTEYRAIPEGPARKKARQRFLYMNEIYKKKLTTQNAKGVVTVGTPISVGTATAYSSVKFRGNGGLAQQLAKNQFVQFHYNKDGNFYLRPAQPDLQFKKGKQVEIAGRVLFDPYSGSRGVRWIGWMGVDLVRALYAMYKAGYSHNDLKFNNIVYDEVHGVFRLLDLGNVVHITSSWKAVIRSFSNYGKEQHSYLHP
jgi:hypothetical protein